ncbi:MULTISPECIES: FadR/GntR family transcriptional regulator [unclassified Arthrobacter]|uniref:FadR/GntR family transcriptional regulator n=1 Tax=unclassified Arthrobacter TaxID=235627 RepID=UPI001D13D578|nr:MULTISPECIES: FCD domain-containing protein [unclassified Arthrobacter]MCC3275648.1 FCD domain-containing protein [Arthrobacter sp. zg-Y20]MCC3278726.1 FCD domain-containing protein [Arthrobacter sp. zg-Y40]MCC9177088.1 FCD domain-containing protein [Arthrobacter sp. zg-Y750]MDK1315805.1 FCD domain-containing protein [Arthrobacter sp. zg.Y20]MDK1326200.1 FCD domain-containing protein [Arthrobacter sp. zg-Y1143]
MSERAAPAPQAAVVLNGRIIEVLGQDIVSGVLMPGDRLTLEGLQQEFGVSRTVVRDCMRILESMNLVYSKRRVGIVVLEPGLWNVFDPRVIKWRLQGPGRTEQFRTLTELRVGVEPVAAAGAARRASDVDRARLVELAAELRRLGEAGELEGFLQADIEFHTLLLRASGNDMFASLQEVVAAVLTGRTIHKMMPPHPTEEALSGHALVAAAVAGGDDAAALAHMAGLLEEVRLAVSG